MKRAVIIGAGIGGLATANLLARLGYTVAVYEKLAGPGGRAEQFTQDGFVFDAGPSWYLMPEVFDHFFQLLGVSISDYLSLTRLDPAYAVYFEGQSQPTLIHADYARDAATFDAIEPGASLSLQKYLQEAAFSYQAALDNFLHTNFSSLRSFADTAVLTKAPLMARRALQPLDAYVSTFFTDPRLKQIVEYPMVFLGTSPFKAPALYSLMSHMDFTQGVYYPQGGFFTIITALETLARQAGVQFAYGQPVAKIITRHGHAVAIELADGEQVAADLVISNADLHFTETALLSKPEQTYSPSYWRRKQPGPSAILMYLGIKGMLPELQHHTLLFTKDWRANFAAVFDTKTWPQPAPLYLSNPSKTDTTVAPKSYENLFVLVPGPATLEHPVDVDALADIYLEQIESMTGIHDLRARIVTRRIVGPDHFAKHLNAWQGTALGLSHVLSQSAFLRPRNKSKKVANLYYVGGSTVPGIGLPMCLISAQLVVKRLIGDTSNRPLARLPELKK